MAKENSVALSVVSGNSGWPSPCPLSWSPAAMILRPRGMAAET